jgi:hypothetical protein
MRNILGLVSGNFKRHLVAKHGYGQLVFDLFGDRLADMGERGCAVCERHQDLLRK